MTRRKLLTNHLNPSSLLRRSWVLILLAVGSFALSPQTQAVQPDSPDPGNPPISNTRDGLHSLLSITTGIHNSAFGFDALLSNSTGNFNTAVGSVALLLNNGDPTVPEGIENTAVGTGALLSNTTGVSNTAVGAFALLFNSVGPFNTAVGFEALMNLNGPAGTGNANAAFGDLALINLSTGFFNTAVGAAAGFNQTTGHNNVYIGQGSFGVAGENNTCYIQGIAGSSIPTANANFVFVDITTGQLATILVNADGNRVTVPISPSQLQAAPQGKYEAVPQRSLEDGRQAMLNLKVKELQATVAQQQKQIEALTTGLQKVSAQIEVNKPAPQVVVNKP